MNIKRNNQFISAKQKHEAYISKDYCWEMKNSKPVLIDKRTNSECNPDNIYIKIAIYENRVNGWFLDHADILKRQGHTGFVILQIAVSYIEGNQQFREGKLSINHSRDFFIKGMRRIFDKEHIHRNVISHFYDQVRCGLFHNGMTKEKVFISCDFHVPISVRNSMIYIHPHDFLDRVKADFSSYIADLKNTINQDLRVNFDKLFYFGKDKTENR